MEAHRYFAFVSHIYRINSKALAAIIIISMLRHCKLPKYRRLFFLHFRRHWLRTICATADIALIGRRAAMVPRAGQPLPHLVDIFISPRSLITRYFRVYFECLASSLASSSFSASICFLSTSPISFSPFIFYWSRWPISINEYFAVLV